MLQFLFCGFATLFLLTPVCVYRSFSCIVVDDSIFAHPFRAFGGSVSSAELVFPHRVNATISPILFSLFSEWFCMSPASSLLVTTYP